MEASTLQTPKTGRSRFSKALPAPPSFLESKKKSPLPSLPPTLPSLPPQLPPLSLGLSTGTESPKPPEKSLPPVRPLPPPKESPSLSSARETPTMAAVSRPLDSPLPPLPKKLGGLPLMSIPRRPVAAPAPVAVSPAPAPVSPALSPSPVGSISSLLSAYSNHSSETTPRSSTNSTVSPGEPPRSSDIKSPVAVTTPLTSVPERNAQKQENNGLRTTAVDEELPPPPPLKDIHRPNTPPVSQKSQAQPSQSPTDTQSPSILNNSSSQDQQLWRRRSVRSEKNLAVPELKLVTSHGSTAASVTTSSQGVTGGSIQASDPVGSQGQSEPVASPAGTRVPPPRTPNAAFPGRNIRPVPSQQIAAQESNMGQKTSSLARELTSRGRDDGETTRPSGRDATRVAPRPVRTVSPVKSMPNIASPHSIVRLPTPEYESSDLKHPIVETVVSPVSPASSPDLPTEAKSSVSSSNSDTNTTTGGETHVRHAKSSPSLAAESGTPTFAGRPPMGLPAPPAANRTPSQSQFPARTSSKAGDQYRPYAAAGRRDPAGPSPLPVPKLREQQYRQPATVRTVSENGSVASDETVRPRHAVFDVIDDYSDAPAPSSVPESNESEESDMTDHPGAALFPRNWYKPAVADEIMDARPLETKHFRCLTSHRYMTAARQRVNPIACRTCGHKDRNADCYICSACHLNICAGCSSGLRKLKGDLDQLLESLNAKEEEGRESPESARGTARPDSETFTIPPTDPPLTFVIEAQ
ncbi:hypothetical protein OQA88_281 [Cercophora sp. LCS_1]